MFRNLIFATLFVAFVVPAAAGAQAVQPAQTSAPVASSAPPPDSALSGRFTTFFKQILAGHTPTGNLSSQMRSGLTPQLIGQIDGVFSAFGTFRTLQYVGADTMQGYTRYHYTATFASGSQPVMFIVDSHGAIAGFFQDRSQ